MSQSNLDRIIECLDAGIELEIEDERGTKRRFLRGHITREVNSRGSVRTTHTTSNGKGYVRLSSAAVVSLAAQAAEKLSRKDEILAAKDAARRAAFDF